MTGVQTCALPIWPPVPRFCHSDHRIRPVYKCFSEVDDQGASKKGKKNDKAKCYRCGFAGHVLSDCTVIICDYCEKVDHVADVCPLLTAPKPQIVVYGHAHDSLMFFEMVCTDSYRPKTENTRYQVVTVVGGDMTPPQIIRQLQRLVPEKYI